MKNLIGQKKLDRVRRVFKRRRTEAMKRLLDAGADVHAEKQLKSAQRFGDLVTESVEPDTAATIAALDIHRPLTRRARQRKQFAELALAGTGALSGPGAKRTH